MSSHVLLQCIMDKAKYVFIDRVLLVILLITTDEPELGWLEWLGPALLAWCVNFLLVFSFLSGMFIFGEPITKPLTEAATTFWRHRKQADLDLARVCSILGVFL